MKTSNKLILAALLLLVVSLVSYDYMIKSEFLSGTYLNPYKDFVTLKFKDFDVVDVNSSTAANVKFVQGPFSVRIDTNAMEYVRFKQQSNRLQINAVFENNYLYNNHPFLIIISCPKLSQVNANATYSANNKQIIDTIVKDDWNMKQVLIEGFKQDSLSIRQDYGSTVVLANNNIRLVKATVGKSPGSGSKIIVLKGNQFQDVNFDILNKSRFLLNDAVIHNLSYNLADSAKLVLSGAAKKFLKK
jgi:Putative auto-transporter adhesin, head GIN domain